MKRFAAMSELLNQVNLPISLYVAIDGSKIPPVSVVCRDGYHQLILEKRFDNGTLFDPLKRYNNKYSVYDLDTENKWKLKSLDPVEPLFKIVCWKSHLQIYFDILSFRKAKSTCAYLGRRCRNPQKLQRNSNRYSAAPSQ